MQTLYTTIKTNRLQAIKQKQVVAKTVLTTLVGELDTQAKRLGQPVSDSMVLGLIKKFIEANKESLSHQANETLQEENDILAGYLPSQLDEDEIKAVIVGLGTKNIGEIMKYLNQNYDGKYDRRMASNIAKSL